MTSNPDPERLRQLTDSARALPPAEREAHVRQEVGGDHALQDAILKALSEDDAETQATTDGLDAARSSGGRVQSSATDELMDRLEESPKLDVERYEFEGEVDRGGMGAILKIHDRHLNRRLAMKVLLDREPPRDEIEEKLAHQLLGRFLEEAQVTSQLDHPGVVPVHELGLDQNGKVFFTMRLIKGRTASAVFKDAHQGKGDWTVTRAIEVMLKVCDTMAFAHSKGILHRDLKPDNVMVGRFGEVYVMDWGLAKVLGQADHHDLRIRPEDASAISQIDSARGRDAEDDLGSSVVSMDGQKLGTPSYMSPEQARSEELDPRADVYSIGAMLYQLLAGRAPYTTPGVRKYAYRILEDVADGPPKRVDEIEDGVPAELGAITEKAMARNRDKRYADVTDLAADLRAYLDQRAVQAHRTGAVVELKLWVRRNKPLAASLLAAAVILMVGMVVSMTLAGRNADLARDKSELAAAETLAKNAAQDLASKETAAREKIEANSYIANLEMAKAWLGLSQIDRARTRLGACPSNRRDWEWHWLNAQTHPALSEVQITAPEWSPLKIPHMSLQGGVVTSDSLILMRDDSVVWVWNAATGETIAKLEGHTKKVTAASFSSDGTRIVSTSWDQTARTWDAATGKALAVIKAHTDRFDLVSFSPDGSRVVTVSKDKTARVWNATTGALLVKLAESTNPVFTPAFSSDGTRLLASSRDNTPCLWSAVNGDVLAVLTGHTKKVISASFSRDGTRIVTTSLDRTARVWNASTGEPIAELKGSTLPVLSAEFSPNGTRIVTCTHEKVARVWDAASGQVTAMLTGHSAGLVTASFSPDGTQLVTVADDKTARIWEASTGVEIALLAGSHEGVEAAWFTSSGDRIITLDEDGTAQVWNVRFMEAPLALGGSSERDYLVTVGPDPNRFVTTGLSDTAEVHDIVTNAPLVALEGHTGAILSVSYGPNGTYIVTSSEDHTARVWDAATGAQIAALKGHSGEVWAAAFSPNGRKIVTASEDQTARVWDASSGETLAVLKGHSGAVMRASFSHDGTSIVTASADKTARVWAAETGRILRELKGHLDLVDAASFSPDGTCIATASTFDDTARFWDAETGESLPVLGNHTSRLTPASFSPDDKLIVIAVDLNAQVRDAQTGHLVVDLEGHTDEVNSASFSPNGSRIVTASEDGSVRVWNPATGDPVAEFMGALDDFGFPAQGIWSAAFSSDGTRIEAQLAGGGVLVWDAARPAVRFAERQQLPQGQPRSDLRAQFAREMRGESPPTWLTDPSLSENRPNFMK